MPVMETSDLTARQYWAQVKANRNRAKFGFGTRPAIVNIDVQRAYTDMDTFPNAYQTDPRQIDPRADVQPGDIVMHKLMASPFFETNLWSLLTFHRIDTLIITGGSTSGCVRACSVDSLSRGFRTIVVEECVADKHEIPHFANLADIMLKYADVESVDEVAVQLRNLAPAVSAP